MLTFILKFAVQNILKTAGAAAIAHGLTTETDWQTIAGFVASLVGWLWHWYEAHGHAVAVGTVQPLQSPKAAASVVVAFLLLLPLMVGCSYVRVYDKEHKTGFSSVVPAWPWQDSTRVLDRMNVSSKTNGFTASLRGLNEQENTSTNIAQMAGQILGDAIRAAVVPK